MIRLLHQLKPRLVRRDFCDFHSIIILDLEVVAEDVSDERAVPGISRMESPEEEIEVVVGNPEVQSLGEFKHKRRGVPRSKKGGGSRRLDKQ